MSLFYQHIGQLYESCKYAEIREELHKFENSKKPFPGCIYKELDYAESEVYRKIRDENVFPIRFLWLFEFNEYRLFGITSTLSYYSPKLLYNNWQECMNNNSVREEAEKFDVCFDMENKAISLTKGWVLMGDTFLEDLKEVKNFYGRNKHI